MEDSGGGSRIYPDSESSRYCKTLRRVTYRCGPYRLNLRNQTGLPAETVFRLVECWRRSYPLMVSRFNQTAAKSISAVIDPDYQGIAETMGTAITLSGQHFAAHPWDCDVMTHELFHVVQNYGDQDYPFWAMEGLADYARHKYGLYNSQGGWSLPELSPTHKHTDAYRVTARFFAWLENLEPSFPVELDRSLRDGTYHEKFWMTSFDQPLEQLWSAYRSAPTIS